MTRTQPGSSTTTEGKETLTPRANGGAHPDNGKASMPSTSTAEIEGTPEVKQWTDAELISLAEHMQQEIEIRDRVRRFRRYECCFTGSDAVAWLTSNDKAATPEEAVMLGNDMLRAGLLHHVSFKRPFQDKDSLYRFLDVGEASDFDDTSSTQTPKPEEPERHSDEFESFERLYDDLWARREPGQSSSKTGNQSSASPSPSPGPKTVDEGNGAKSGRHGVGTALRGTNRGSQWSMSGEVTHLQRRVADLAAELQAQQEMNRVLCDMQTLQMKNQQELFSLLQSRLERAIRRGTWIGMQLQVVFVFVVVLLAAQAQAYLSGLPASALVRVAAALVPYIACLPVAAVMCWAPWEVPPKTAPVVDATSASQEPEEAAGGAEVESREQQPAPEGASGVERQSEHRDASAAPRVADFEGWPDAPMLVRPAPLDYQHVASASPSGQVRINDGRRIEFETPLFKGCAVIWAQGLPTTPEALFEGRRRKTSITIQGRFKRELDFEDVVTGQEFGRPAQNLPAKWLVETVLIKLAKRISPSMEIGPLTAPYLLVPVMALAQVVNVSRPGEEPDPAGHVPEDVRLHDSAFSDPEGGPTPATKRKKFMWAAKHRAGRRFSTEHVWTFQLYQHFVDMGKYELNMIYKFDLTRNLDGQPLQFMVKDRGSDQYLLNLHAWHERLLEKEKEPSK